MKIKYLFLSVLFAAAVFLPGCDKADSGGAVQATRPPVALLPETIRQGETAAKPEAASEAGDAGESIQYAGLYRDVLYRGGEVPTGINLSEQETAAIVGALEAAGLVAFDSARQLPVTNPEDVYSFFEAVETGGDTVLSLFEVCPDGGFLRRDLAVSGDERELTLTRLVWNKGEPEISFSSAYEITDLYLSQDGNIVYDYYYPNNPKGENHDGHVDTLQIIALNP